MKLRGNDVNLWIILEGVLWSFFISIIIRTLPLKSVFRIITPGKSKKFYDRELILNSLNLVLSLQNKFIPVKCWKKSMLIFRALKKYGHEPRIHFGVSITDLHDKKKILTGHSWLTINNTLIYDNDSRIIGDLTEILTYP